MYIVSAEEVKQAEKQMNGYLTWEGCCMWNYEHEILCSDNKEIRNYLWYDYFHGLSTLNQTKN